MSTDKKEEIYINERRHKKVPDLSEHIQHSMVTLLFGFILINIIAFWMFTSIRLGKFYLVFGAHSISGSFGSILPILLITLLIWLGLSDSSRKGILLVIFSVILAGGNSGS